MITGIPLLLPALGEGIAQATVTRWLKRIGDPVAEGEPLLEAATDKVDTEVPSLRAGILVAILVDEGETAEVGAELAVIEPGSGRELDPVPAAAPALIARTASADRVEKLSPTRRVIAERMMRSLNSTAQLTTVVEVDVSAVAAIRQRYKAAGRSISYLPFFVKAAVDGLAVHPIINSAMAESNTDVIYHGSVGLGIAVDSPRGLMVPVIRDAQTLSTDDLATAIADVAERVRSGSIAPVDLDGGTFTITNTGSRGALFDTPILNYPQSAILGTGAVVRRVVPLPGDEVRIGVRHYAYFSLSYDHRVIDGADAARYLGEVKSHIEAGDFGPQTAVERAETTIE